MRLNPITLLLLSSLFAATAVAQDPKGSEPAPAKPAVEGQDEKKENEKEKAKPAGPLEIGATIGKEVSLPDIDGKPFKFEDARGKVVVLHFWSTTCPYEKAAEPKLMALAEKFGDKVVVLAVNANKREIGAEPDAKDFEKEEGKPYGNIRKHAATVKFNHRILVDHDGSMAKLLDGKTTPHCFVFDGEGVLRYQGALDDDSRGRKGDEATQYVRMAVDAVLADEKVETPKTKPYG